jgi:hypothetical protein
MNALVEQVAQVERELDLLLASDETIRAIDEIEGAIDQLDGCNRRTTTSLTERRALSEGSKGFSFADALEDELSLREKAVDSFALVKTAWKEDRARVRQSGAVGELAATLKSYQNLVARNNKIKWQAWVDSLASDFEISDAELESVRGIPDYVRPISKYRSRRQNFTDIVQRIPHDAAVVRDLAVQAESLKAIKGGIVFDLPKFVLEFFDTLNDNGQFPLARLTKELSEWLSENNELKNLSIIRRGMPRF